MRVAGHWPGPERVESWPDGEWTVRAVTGAAATKAYRCPGCDQEVPERTPHVVAWRVGDVEDRRHWHTPCWRARDRRRPDRRRG
ncbi:MAG: hypothetical protein M3P95_01540 [Actinomycetota bacterium]|nr:hypothetical protein [Actinomycetota bacterium]